MATRVRCAAGPRIPGATAAQQQVAARQADVDQLAARLATADRDRRTLEVAFERLHAERELRAGQRRELAAQLVATLRRWLAALPVADAGELRDADDLDV